MTGGTRERRQQVAARWHRGAQIAAALCLAVLLLNVALSTLSPSSPWGLSYGVAATVLMIGAALLGLRRRTMHLATRWKLGSSRAWLLFHIYGGALFLLLVLMHSAFRVPTGGLTWWLWAISIWTVASGLLGLVLQRWIPRVLASGLSIEVIYERIPELVAELRQRAQELVATCGEPIQQLYARSVEPVLATPQRRLIYFVDITGGVRSRRRDFDYLRSLLGSEERVKLAELQQLFETKLEIDAHYSLQRLLRVWLWLHLPTSLVLVALLVLHVWTVIYY